MLEWAQIMLQGARSGGTLYGVFRLDLSMPERDEKNVRE